MVTHLLAMQETRVQFSLGALRGRAVAAHKAHNLEVDGSIPSPATLFRTWESLEFRVRREHEIVGSNPTVLTEKYRWADVGVRGWLLTTYEETLRRFDSCCRC